MAGVVSKVTKWKGENKAKVFIPVMISIVIVTFYYVIYFDNQIMDSYIVHNYKIDNMIKLTSSESIQLHIGNPFDQLYLPLVFCNTDKVSLTVEDGDAIKNVVISANTDKIVSADKEETDLSFFWELVDYYCLDGIVLRPDKLQSDYVITLSIEGDGFVVLGVSGESAAYRTTKNTNVNNIIFIIVSLVLIIGTAVVSQVLINQSDILKTYTVIAVLLGCIYFVLFPPVSTNDSKTHIIAMYERTNSMLGHSDWNEVDGNANLSQYETEDGYIIDEVMTNYLYCPSPDTKIYDGASYAAFIDMPNESTVTSSWHKDLSSVKNIVYLPYLLTLLLGRLLNWNLMFTLQIAKLVGLICYLLMIRFAIKLMPYGKDALAVFSLTPMVMQSMVSIGYDLFCIGASFIMFAYILKLDNEKHSYTWKDIVLTVLLSVVLIPSKGGVYFACAVFLAACLFVLPVIIKKPKYLIGGGIAFAIAGILFLVKYQDYFISEHVEGMYSISDLFQDPISIGRFMFLSMLNDMDRLIQGIFGGRLGWDETIEPWYVVISYIVLFCATCQYDDELRPKRKEKLVCISALILFVFGIYCIFLGETKLTSASIYGIQGRYFIPLMPLIICVAKSHNFKVKFEKSVIYSSLWFVSIIQVMQMMVVYLRR